MSHIYFISGQGADSRLFTHIKLESKYEIHHIEFELPEKGATMKDYANQLSHQISKPYNEAIIIGVSIGGMIATEMTELLHPKKTIVISSAKKRQELPKRYRIFKSIPIQKIVPAKVFKSLAKIAQPIVEPDQNKEKDTFKAMLNDKDPLFLKRTIPMVINWNRSSVPDGITHIHGNKDNTIPINCVNYDYLIEGGSHMMALTKGKEISKLLNQILNTDNL